MGLSYAGYTVILDRNMGKQVIDFSGCRSPSRAERRLRKGIRNPHIVVRQVSDGQVYLFDGNMVMHPDDWEKLKQQTKNFDEGVGNAPYRSQVLGLMPQWWT